MGSCLFKKLKNKFLEPPSDVIMNNYLINQLSLFTYNFALLFAGFLFCLTTDKAFSQIPIFTENFESFTPGSPGTLQNGWNNIGGDDFDWFVDNLGTPSNSTGPTIDRTSGTTSGIYMYTEASGINSPSKIAILVSPAITLNPGADHKLEFWYHMYGNQMGVLNIDVFNGSVWTTVDNISGQQQTVQTQPWRKKSVSLSAFSGNIQIRFRGVTGSSFTSDMAIDDVRIFDVTPIVGQKAFGGTLVEYGRAVDQTADGGFIMVGTTYSFGLGNNDMYAVRTDKDGDTICSCVTTRNPLVSVILSV